LDQLVYQVERTMNDAKDKLPVELGQEVSTALEEAKEALKKDDASAWDAAETKLKEASGKMAEHLYKQTADEQQPPSDGGSGGASAGGGGSTSEQKKDDDVIDADWSEAN
jgi:molecular chaperone DnaK